MNEEIITIVKDKCSRKKVFRSRYSILLIIIILLPMVFMINSYIQRPNNHILIPIAIIGFLVLVISGIRYIIVDDRLIFKTWFINNGEISIASILKIERSYSVLASNAGSLKRLACKLKKGSKYPFLIISPINEEVFLEKLKQINPKIQIKVTNTKGFYRFWDWDI